MMIDEAIILAGGLGTRLGVLTENTPKPMIEVNGKPFLEHLLIYLEKQGIRRVIMSVGYLSEKITSFFGSRYGALTLKYSIEEEPLGTGGAIWLSKEMIVGEKVLILNGDSYLDVDLLSMYNFHIDSNSEITLALKNQRNIESFGMVTVAENGRIKSFCEKQNSGQGTINCGVYLVNLPLKLESPVDSGFSFEKDFLERQCRKMSMYGFMVNGYFCDIGDPRRLEAGIKYFQLLKRSGCSPEGLNSIVDVTC